MLVDPRYDDATFENVGAAMDKAEISDAARLKMYKERRFGIDWGVGPQTSIAASDERDWDVSMKRMWELCRDGGLIFIPAQNTPGNVGLIGQVPAGADIEIRDYEARDSEGEDIVTMKTLKLHRVREVHPDDGTGLYEINYGRHTVHWLNEHRDAVVDAYTELY